MRNIHRPIKKERFIFLPILNIASYFFHRFGSEEFAGIIDFFIISPQIVHIRTTPIKEMWVTINTSTQDPPEIIESLCRRSIFFPWTQMPLSDTCGLITVCFHSFGNCLFFRSKSCPSGISRQPCPFGILSGEQTSTRSGTYRRCIELCKPHSISGKCINIGCTQIGCTKTVGI